MQADTEVVIGDVPSRRGRALFGVYLAFIGVYTLYFSAGMARNSSPWIVGDWLVNYSGGFVRRGLIGSVVLALHQGTGVPANWIVFSVQVVLYVVFLVNVYRLTRDVRWTPLMAAILLSPATMAFTVLDTYAGMRKEILLFAGLAFAVRVVSQGRWKDWQLSALFSVLVVLMVLSHEALVVGIPYLFAALLIQNGDLKRSLRMSAVPAILGGMALLAVVSHTGSRAIAEAVCTSVGGTMAPFGGDAPAVGSPGICDGSIWWIGLSTAEARAIIVPVIRETHMVPLFAVLTLLGWGPMFVQMGLFYWRDGLRREMRVMAGCCVLSLGATAVLFYTALDWGRWVHMQALCLMLMILMMDARGPVRVSSRAGGWLTLRGAVVLVVVFAYATAWTLPSIGVFGMGHGYLDVIRMFRHMQAGR